MSAPGTDRGVRRYARDVLVGRSGLSPVMVGRDAALAELEQLAGRPSGGVALLGGEAGMGKSRLVREFLAAAPEGLLALAGQADPGSLGRPFELVLDAVSAVVASDDERVAELRSADSGRTLAERLATAVELVVAAAGSGPAAVVFDDLHWADGESIAVFEQLAAAGRPGVLLIGTYRPSEITRRHPLAEVLPRIDRRADAVHLRLERFTVADVAAFLGAVYGGGVSHRVAESLHTRTGGNPFFLEELLMAARGVPLDDLCSAPLPWNLAEIVRGQVDELDDRERSVVETAAVLGRRVSFDVLSAVTGLEEGALITVLRTLIDHGLLVEIDADVFAFRHDLTREAIGDRPLGREQRRLHEAALAALHASGSTDLAAMARHASGAGRFAEVVELARRGTSYYLEQGSSYQALGLAELGLSEAPGDPGLRAAAARAAWLAGLLGDAIEHATRLEADADAAGDLERRSEARRLLVRLQWEAADQDGRAATVRNLTADLDLLDDGEERAEILCSLAQEAMLENRADEALAWADQAIEAAERLGLPHVRRAALVEKGSVLLNQRLEAAEAAKLLVQVAEEATAAGEHVLASRAWHNAAFTSPGLLPVADRLVMFDRMRAAASRVGWDSQAIIPYCEGRYFLAVEQGQMDEAGRWLDEARRTGPEDRCVHSWIPLHVVELALERGDFDAARRSLAAMTAVSQEKSEQLLALRAQAALAAGLAGEARVHLDALATKAATEGLDGVSMEVLIVRALDLGADSATIAALVTGIRRFSAQVSPLVDTVRGRFEAHLVLARGDAEAAVAAFERVLGTPLLDLPRTDPERGIDEVAMARALLLVREPARAAEHAALAADLLGEWSGWRLDALASVQRRLGPRADPGRGAPSALTPREREVLALVAEGCTNAELAERLYISPRTAGVHVSNILAKLGVSSRTEAAAWAVRASLDPA